MRRLASCLPSLLAAAVVACARPAAAPPAPTAVMPTTGVGVLEAMRARYADRWYRTLTFVQRTVQAPPTGGPERESVWFETMQLPGRLRIDTDSTLRTGRLFANDSTYAVRDGRLVAAVPGHNALLVLAFDVYGQPAARTASVLRGLGFPAGPVRADTWDGRPAWVVGGAPGDTHAPQYWIDRERLVFLRLMQPWPGDTTKTFEARFHDYRPLAGGWIAPRVEAYVDGRRTLFEEYRDIRANPPVDPALFDPRRWTAGRHWVGGK